MILAVKRSAGVLAAIVLAAFLVAMPTAPANAETNHSGSGLSVNSTFYIYSDGDDYLDLVLTRLGGSAHTTLTAPDGTEAFACDSAPGIETCQRNAANGGRLALDQEGVWTVFYDIGTETSFGGRAHSWVLQVYDGATTGSTAIPGRVWTEKYSQYQSAASNQTYTVVTGEGYWYELTLNNYNGIGSSFRANGFGLVYEGTCTPIYRSAEGTVISSGVPLEAGVTYSGPECGDAYKIFFDTPAADLPATAQSARGTEWIINEVVPASVTDLTFEQDAPSTRAGQITFDLAGVNGGYAIEIDTNNNGSFDDAVDRVIPWGSPPGPVTVPFDGLDGEGMPIGVCQPMNARVSVDRVGEAHFVLEDVETVSGINLSGVTPGLNASEPLLYWDDRTLTTNGRTPTPVIDGRNGIDASVEPAHGWPLAGSWGDQRSIENWTYYEASTGETIPVPTVCDPSMELDKVGTLVDENGNGVADLGETIDYTFTATNTGNTELADVTVNDSRITTGITPASQDIPVGGTAEFTASYTVTQDDIDAGTVHNAATATGTDPAGGTVDSPEATDDVPTVDRAPELTLEKSGRNDDSNGNGVADVGELVEYTFEVTNTGNVTVTDVTIDDPRVPVVEPASATIAPGDSATFVGFYEVTQADVNMGEVYNVATAVGTSPLGPITSLPSDERIATPEPDAGLTIVKEGALTTDANGNGLADLGDELTYTFTVTNTGNVDLVGVTVDDPRVPNVTPGPQALAPGATVEFTGTLLVEQADVDAGVVLNSATAGGTYEGPDGDVPVDSPPSTFDHDTVPPAPALTVDKAGSLNDANNNGVADLGETIDYAFTVTNTGNTTLENVSVNDPRVTGLVPEAATLLPGEQVTFTAAPYTVTQDDIDAGRVANTATAGGNVPNGPEITSPPAENVVNVPAANPSLSIEKFADLMDANGNGTADAGEEILYSFEVVNTGNVTLSDVTVIDDRISGLVPASIDTLAPGATFTFRADPYVVTDADVASGAVVNVASAAGTAPGAEEPTNSETDTVTTETTATTVSPTPGAGGPDDDGSLITTDGPLGWAGIGVVAVAVGALITGGLLTRRNRTS